MSGVSESETAQEWNRLEGLLRDAQLWDEPVSALFRELRDRVVFDRNRPSNGLRATVKGQDVHQLMPLLVAISLAQRQLIIAVLQPSSICGLLLDAQNGILRDDTISETRRMFGLGELPDPEFRLSLERVIVRLLAWLPENAELLQFIQRETPERIPGSPNRLEFALSCADDWDVLTFIESLSARMERRASEMWESIAGILFVPCSSPKQGAVPTDDWSEADERDLREFLHWISLLIHRQRHAFGGQIRKLRPGPCGEIFGTIVEYSLFECAMIAFLRRRFPDVMRELVYLNENLDEEPLPAGAGQRELVRQAKRVQSILDVIDVLVSQWQHLAEDRKKWTTGNLKQTTGHLMRVQFSLKNLLTLHWLAEETEASTLPAAEDRPTTTLPRLAAYHTRLDIQADPRYSRVYFACHDPGYTNLVRGETWQVEQSGQKHLAASVVRHHAQGRPCLPSWSLVPLHLLFHPESRLVLMAQRLAAQADALLDEWEEACESSGLNGRMAELRARKCNVLHLISICDRTEKSLASMFVLSEVSVGGMFSADRLTPITGETRDLMAAFATPIADGMVALPVEDLVDEDEWTEADDNDWDD